MYDSDSITILPVVWGRDLVWARPVSGPARQSVVGQTTHYSVPAWPSPGSHLAPHHSQSSQARSAVRGEGWGSVYLTESDSPVINAQIWWLQWRLESEDWSDKIIHNQPPPVWLMMTNFPPGQVTFELHSNFSDSFAQDQCSQWSAPCLCLGWAEVYN